MVKIVLRLLLRRILGAVSQDGYACNNTRCAVMWDRDQPRWARNVKHNGLVEICGPCAERIRSREWI